MIRIVLLIVGGLIGALAVSLAPSGLRERLSVPGISGNAPRGLGHEKKPDDGRNRDEVRLTQEQVEAAQIAVAPSGSGTVERKLVVPGSIQPAGDRIARVAVRLLGTVSELRKNLGETVAAGEVVAVIESREVADAKTEYLATKLTNDLQQTLFARAKMLFEGKVTSENDFLRARTISQDAQVKFEVARQKLFALGLSDEQIAALPEQDPSKLRRQELRAPISGRIAERRVDVGSLVGREGQESELYIIVNLDEVWATLSVPLAELPGISEGQQIAVRGSAGGSDAPARITFISPLLDKETRAARVVATLVNAGHRWRPGTFVTADVPLSPVPVAVAIPREALQTIGTARVAFVRTAAGFEKRDVQAGRSDDRIVEIVSGLKSGEIIAVANTFTLKAELGKGDAEHDD